MQAEGAIATSAVKAMVTKVLIRRDASVSRPRLLPLALEPVLAAGGTNVPSPDSRQASWNADSELVTFWITNWSKKLGWPETWKHI